VQSNTFHHVVNAIRHQIPRRERYRGHIISSNRPKIYPVSTLRNKNFALRKRSLLRL